MKSCCSTLLFQEDPVLLVPEDKDQKPYVAIIKVSASNIPQPGKKKVLPKSFYMLSLESFASLNEKLFPVESNNDKEDENERKKRCLSCILGLKEYLHFITLGIHPNFSRNFVKLFLLTEYYYLLF